MLNHFDKPVPRYTSYPTAPDWGPLSEDVYRQYLKEANQPIGLYFHIPFCRTMCLYCGCSVVLNRKRENEKKYVEMLIREIGLLREALGCSVPIQQIHFGGGTPTKLLLEDFREIFDELERLFLVDWKGEIAIEVDPRTVFDDNSSKLRELKKIGFNRVSFGVQDTNPAVQEAVRRYQTLEMTETTYKCAREIGFEGINIDLIYGLPHQTEESFKETLKTILHLRPDRIALFSYAKVPWIKPHQKAIPEKSLPSTEEKFRLYLAARHILVHGGYLALGMDHFALENDPLSLAFKGGYLHRNFQGYAIKKVDMEIGLGMTSITNLGSGYFQNLKTLPAYYEALEKGQLPIHVGKILSDEDQMRRFVIHSLMCHFYIDKRVFLEKFGVSFDIHFSKEIARLDQFDGWIDNQSDSIRVMGTGRLFIRNVASVFDAYLEKNQSNRFSKAI